MGCGAAVCHCEQKANYALSYQKIIANSQLSLTSSMTTQLPQQQKKELLYSGKSLLKQGKLIEAKELYKLYIKNDLRSEIDIFGVGCLEEQTGFYEHRPIDWLFQNIPTFTAYDALSMCFMVTKEYQEAQEFYQKMLELSPKNYRLALALGHVHMNTKQYDQARMQYSYVTQLKPTFDKAYQLLAMIYKLQKLDRQQVKVWAQNALVYNKKNFYALYILAISEQQTDSKIEKLKKVAKMSPKYGRTYNSLGNAYKKKGDSRKAIQNYKKCIDLSLKYEAPYIGLGNIYREKGMHETAIQFFQKAIQIKPGIDIAYNGLGNVYNQIEEFDKAIQNYEKSIEINKDFSASYYGKGIALKRQGKLGEAKKQLQKSISINNQYTLAYEALGHIFIDLFDFDKAIETFLKALQLNPHKAKIYFELGQSYYKKEDLQKARECYDKSLELDPGLIESLYALGNLNAKEDKLQEAYNYCKKCIDINQKYEWGYFGIGKILKKQKQYDQAEEEYKKCLKINPNNYHVLHALGNIYSEKDQEEEAVIYYQKAIEACPQFFSAHYSLGNSYFILQEYEKAIKSYTLAAELNEKDYHPYNGLGNCFKVLQVYDEAIKWYELAIKINPDNDVAYYGIANIYSLQGDFQQAQEYFKLALDKNNNNTLCKMNLGFLYLKIQNFKKAFQLISSAKENIEEDTRLTATNRQYLKENINLFEQEAEEWQIKKKTGFISEESRAHLTSIIDHFEERVKFLYNSIDSSPKKKAKTLLNPGIVKIISLLYQDKFNLTHIKPIFYEVHKLFLVDEDYFHILPQIFCQHFWSKKFVYDKPIAAIESHLSQTLSDVSNQYKNKLSSKIPGTPGTIEGFESKIALTILQARAEKINLFQDTQFFPSYQELYSQMKMANKRASQHFDQFKALIQNVKKTAKGFSESACLKMPQDTQNEFKVMLRIMEKMFKEIKNRKEALISKLDESLSFIQNVTVQAVIHEIVKVWTDQITSILQARMESRTPTPCYISDLVRGKIFFNKAADIQLAVKQVEQICHKNNYEILELENRLQKPETRDVVLKVHIGEAVCELQLAYKQNLSAYHFDHCIYEILRSPLGCIFGSYIFMSKGFKYPFLQNCKDIRGKLSGHANLKDRVLVKKVDFIIKTLSTQEIPFKAPVLRMKRSHSQELIHNSSPVRRRRKSNVIQIKQI